MNEKYKIAFFLIAIFILAFGLRGNILQYDTFFEYDQYWEARMARDVLTTGIVNNPDTLAYYQLEDSEGPPTKLSPLWVIEAFIYNILFGWNIGFNESMFLKLMQLIPVVSGALICIVMYFIGKVASNGNKVVGMVAAFVAAVTPAFIYRTMAGAQMSNGFGFLPFSIGILFLLLAMNEKKITPKSIGFALISGGAFFFMVFSWSMYLLIPLMLIPFWAFVSFERLYKDFNVEECKANIIHFGIPIILFIIACFLNNFNWLNDIAVFSGIPLMITSIGIIGCIIFGLLCQLAPLKLSDNDKKYITYIGIGILCIIAIAVFMFTTMGIDRTDRTTVGSMVGEESVGSAFFVGKYNLFLLFIPLALFAPIVLYFLKGGKYPALSLLLFGFIVTFVMAWIKLKFSFVFGYGMIFGAIITALLFLELYNKMKDKNKTELKIIMVPAIAILLMGVAAGGVFILDYTPSLEGDPDLQQVIEYFNTQTPEDSKIMNNWGVGHILSYTTNRAVSTDNRNWGVIPNQQTATFDNDENSELVYDMVVEMDADYILVNRSGFNSFRVNEFYLEHKIDASIGVEFTKPLTTVIDCSVDGNIMNCGGNTINAESLPQSWTTTPTQFYDGRYPIYIYKYLNSIIVLNEAANNTNLAKIFAGTPETDKYYSKVLETRTYLVLKVNK